MKKQAIIVAPKGGDYSSINDALANAVEGDLIYVKRGIFDEAIVLKNGVTIEMNKNAKIYYTGNDAPCISTGNTPVIASITGAGEIISENTVGISVSHGSQITVSADITCNYGIGAAELVFGTTTDATKLIVFGNLIANYGPALFVSDDCYAEVYGNIITNYGGRGGSVENWGNFVHYDGLIQNNGSHTYSVALSVSNSSVSWLNNTRLEVANLGAGVLYSNTINNIVHLNNVTGNAELQTKYSACTVDGDYIIS